LAISDKIFKELNLKVIKQIKGNDALGGQEIVRLILLPEIDLHGITFRNMPGAVFPKNNEVIKLAECFEIDGIIGSNMLRNSIVQFDEQNKQIIITNDIEKVLVHNSECQKMELSFWTSQPYLKVTLQKGEHRAVHNVLFDSGYGGGFFTLSLNNLDGCEVDTIAESEGSFGMSAFGVGKKQKHLLFNIPKFEICGLTFNDVIVTTSQSSLLGTKLLQYGKTTLDYKKKRFYFEPFDSISTSKPIETQWTIYPTFQDGKMVVGIIWDKLLESQINLGDEIVGIDGIDIQSMDFCELLKFEFPNNDKITYELKDIITGEIKTVEIERMK
jgi:hypothetical protein